MGGMKRVRALDVWTMLKDGYEKEELALAQAALKHEDTDDHDHDQSDEEDEDTVIV